MADSFDEAQDLFEAALSLSPVEREAFLRQRCGDDETLRSEVLALLAADVRAGTVIDKLVVDVVAAEELDTTDSSGLRSSACFRAGDTIGPYEIVRLIGEGGFAVVYLAQQHEPVRRQVALKTIKPGMDTKLVLARFEAERQALAMMDHPHIAKVFEAGATDRGHPYFVMEYVEGTPITDHCDSNGFSIEDRLGLFVQLCEAVQHAHVKAVIHRDLKPSNVLVTLIDHRPVPKVIDFGVAKAIEHKLTPDTIHTVHGSLVGTPAYMSPEQVSNNGGIDTRVDVYALGVILFQLLVGRLPFGLPPYERAELSELVRAIREDEPPRPSTLIEPETEESFEMARCRRTQPNALRRTLSGDLDWIALKALEKDRDRRYDSCKRLAEDIERYLGSKPVLASPPSVVYRARKFVRRHFSAVMAVVAAVLFLTVFAVAMAVQADRERRARAELARVVEFQANRLKRVDAQRMGQRIRHQLLVEVRTAMKRSGRDAADMSRRAAALEGLLEGANFTNLASMTLEDTIFRPALDAINEGFDDQPRVKARLLQSLTSEMREAGLVESALSLQQEVVQIRRRALGDEHPDTLTSLHELGDLFEWIGKLDEAAALHREALEVRQRVLGNVHPDTLSSYIYLSRTACSAGNYVESEAYARQALEGRIRVLGADHPDTLEAQAELGYALVDLGRAADAEPYFRAVLEGAARLLGNDHPTTLNALSDVGFVLAHQRKFAEAESFYRRSLQARRRVLGDAHPHTANSLHNLGFNLLDQGKLVEAEPHLGEALEIRRLALGEDSWDTLGSVGAMAYLHLLQGKLVEAESGYRKVLQVQRRQLGEDHPKTLLTIRRLGYALLLRGQPQEAESYLRLALDGFRRLRGPQHRETLISVGFWSELLIAQRRYAEAEHLLREQLPVHVQVFAREDERTAWARCLLGAALAGQERYEEAEALLLEGHDGLASSSDFFFRRRTASSTEWLGSLYDNWGKPDLGARWRAKARTQP